MVEQRTQAEIAIAAFFIADVKCVETSTILRKVNPMADCEQLAGELKVLEELLKQTSTEHKRREIIDRIARIKAEQQERGCLETGQAGQASHLT